MSQKGFATVFGLILILAVALCAKSIQESEMNYSYAAADYQMEFELQNAAVSGIYEAAEKIREKKEKTGVELLPPNKFPTYSNRLQPVLVNRTIEHTDKKHRLKKIHLTVWGERFDHADQKIIRYKVTQYSPTKKYMEIDRKSGYILFSVAESSNERMDGKIYRSVFAYVLSEKQADETYKDEPTIYFMEPKEKD